MTLFTRAEEAQVAQDTVTTVLAGALHAHGSQKALAQRAGVSPVFINYIIKGKRMPSAKMAARLAPLLPLSTGDQSAWLYQVEHYWHTHHHMTALTKAWVNDDAAAAVRGLMTCRNATFSADPQQVRHAWALALRVGEVLAPAFTSGEHAPLYLEYCDVMFEVYSMFGRHVDALHTVKRKQLVTSLMEEGVHPVTPSLDGAAFDAHKVNAMRQEMVVLTELGLCRQACDLARAIEVEPAYLCNRHYWTASLTWDRLNAMAQVPRASLSEARQFAQAAWRETEKLCDGWQPLCEMLVARAFANLCLSQGQGQEARAVLGRFHAGIDQIPYCGALHKVMFLRTWAHTLHMQGEWDEWCETMRSAHAIAEQAGLQNEIRAIAREQSAVPS